MRLYTFTWTGELYHTIDFPYFDTSFVVAFTTFSAESHAERVDGGVNPAVTQISRSIVPLLGLMSS